MGAQRPPAPCPRHSMRLPANRCLSNRNSCYKRPQQKEQHLFLQNQENRVLFCTDKRLKPFFEENAHGIKSINWPQKCRISDETSSFLSQYPPALCYKNYTHCNKRKSRSSAGFPTFDTYYIGTISPDLTPKQNFFEFRLPVTNSIVFVTNSIVFAGFRRLLRR